MRRAQLLALVMLLLATQGCIQLGELIGTERPVEAQEAHRFETAFDPRGQLDPMNPPTGTGDLAARGTGSFDVPRASQRMTVNFSVSFETPELPEDPGRTQEVFLILEGPARHETRSIEIVTDQEGTWTFPAPAPGPWAYRYEARGQGTLSLEATVWAPVDATEDASLR